MRNALAAGALALVLGCIGTGTETGNPSATTTVARIGLTAFSSDPAAVSLPATPSASGVRIAEAWVSVKQVNLVRQTICDGSTEQEIEFTGPVGDLAAQSLVEELEIPATDYCRVRIRIDEPEDGAPPEIDGYSVVIRGTTAAGTAFVLRSEERYQLLLRSKGRPIPIDEARNAILLAFDVKRWFDGVSLDDGTPTGGTIVIEEGSNDDLLTAFHGRVLASLGVYRDRNRDGELDDDERDRLTEDEDDDDDDD